VSENSVTLQQAGFVRRHKRAVGTPLISLRACSGGEFVVSWAGEAYDVRARRPNRKFRLNQGDQQQWPKTLITKLPNITKTPLSRIEPLLSTTEKEIMQPARNTRQSLSSTLGKPTKLRKLPTRNRKSRNSSVIRAVFRGPPRGGLQPLVMAAGRSKVRGRSRSSMLVSPSTPSICFYTRFIPPNYGSIAEFVG
jgi:hypothetical protein